MKEVKVVFIASYLRVGSTWLWDILCKMYKTKHQFIDTRDLSVDDFVELINNSSERTVFKTHHLHPSIICEAIDKVNKDAYVISVSRNIYDVIVSYTMFMRYNEVQKKRSDNFIREIIEPDYKDSNDIEYVRAVVENKEVLRRIVNEWLEFENLFYHPKHLRVTYEQLYFNTVSAVRNIARFLHVKLTDKEILRIVRDTSFKVVSKGRRPGEGDNMQFRRKGIVGDWVNYFTIEHIKIINDTITELIGVK